MAQACKTSILEVEVQEDKKFKISFSYKSKFEGSLGHVKLVRRKAGREERKGRERRRGRQEGREAGREEGRKGGRRRRKGGIEEGKKKAKLKGGFTLFQLLALMVPRY